jgi:hypothetical protein
VNRNIAIGSQLSAGVERQIHNLEVAGSSPAVATNFNRIEEAATKKGYAIDEAGTVTNPAGKRLRGSAVGVNRYKQSPFGYLSFYPGKYPPLRTRCMFHRLQAFKKFGQRIYEPGMVVRHLDGDSRNNRVENIEIGSHSQNQMDVPKDFRRRRAGLSRKYNPIAVRQHWKASGSRAVTMKHFGIKSKGTMHYILFKADETLLSA